MGDLVVAKQQTAHTQENAPNAGGQLPYEPFQSWSQQRPIWTFHRKASNRRENTTTALRPRAAPIYTRLSELPKRLIPGMIFGAMFCAILALSTSAKGADYDLSWVSDDMRMLFPAISDREWATLELMPDQGYRFRNITYPEGPFMGPFLFGSASKKLNDGMIQILTYLPGREHPAVLSTADRLIAELSNGRMVIGFDRDASFTGQFINSYLNEAGKNLIALGTLRGENEMLRGGLRKISPGRVLGETLVHEGVHYRYFRLAEQLLTIQGVEPAERRAILAKNLAYTYREERRAQMIGRMARGASYDQAHVETVFALKLSESYRKLRRRTGDLNTAQMLDRVLHGREEGGDQPPTRLVSLRPLAADEFVPSPVSRRALGVAPRSAAVASNSSALDWARQSAGAQGVGLAIGLFKMWWFSDGVPEYNPGKSWMAQPNTRAQMYGWDLYQADEAERRRQALMGPDAGARFNAAMEEAVLNLN